MFSYLLLDKEIILFHLVDSVSLRAGIVGVHIGEEFLEVEYLVGVAGAYEETVSGRGRGSANYQGGPLQFHKPTLEINLS